MDTRVIVSRGWRMVPTLAPQLASVVLTSGMPENGVSKDGFRFFAVGQKRHQLGISVRVMGYG